MIALALFALIVTATIAVCAWVLLWSNR